MEVPDWQVHEYNADFYIIRESGCTHYEKPFIYLIFGYISVAIGCALYNVMFKYIGGFEFEARERDA